MILEQVYYLHVFKNLVIDNAIYSLVPSQHVPTGVSLHERVWSGDENKLK